MVFGRVRKLLRKARFMLIVRGDDRAEYLRRKSLLRGIGHTVFFQPRKLPNDPGLILFHNNISVASDVTFVSHDVMHRVFNAKNGSALRVNEGCIEIMDNVFIGANAVILPNVRIGPNAIVAAGAIVTRDVPADSIVGGTPAKVIGSFADIESRRLAEGDRFAGKTRGEIDDILWSDFLTLRDDGSAP